MKCDTCGNENAIRIRITARGAWCDAKNCGGLKSLKFSKKGGFMFQGESLHKNSNASMARQVRQEYIGTDHDEKRGRDY